MNRVIKMTPMMMMMSILVLCAAVAVLQGQALSQKGIHLSSRSTGSSTAPLYVKAPATNSVGRTVGATTLTTDSKLPFKGTTPTLVKLKVPQKATCTCGCGGTAQPGCAHKGCSCAGSKKETTDK